MSELVAKVADAILTADESEAQASPTRLSRAAIAAVFDWLAEPSDEAWREGECNSLPWEADAREIWPAMLAEMRRAALG